MSNSDRVKEQLSNVRLIFTAFFAADATMLGWLAQNMGKAENLLVVAASTLSFVLSVLLILMARYLYRLPGKLEKRIWYGS